MPTSLRLLAICLTFYVIEITPQAQLQCKIAAALHLASLIAATSLPSGLRTFSRSAISVIWFCSAPFLVFSLKTYLNHGESRLFTGIRRDLLGLSDVDIILGTLVIVLSATLALHLSPLWLGVGLWSLSLASMCVGFVLLWISSMRPAYGERKLLSSLPVLMLFMLYFSAALMCIVNDHRLIGS